MRNIRVPRDYGIILKYILIIKSRHLTYSPKLLFENYYFIHLYNNDNY